MSWIKLSKEKEVKTSFEVSLAVEDYLKSEDDTELAFEDASEDIVGAKREAKNLLKEYLSEESKKIKIEDTKFLECDSENISHAMAYYEITVSGPSSLISILMQKLQE